MIRHRLAVLFLISFALHGISCNESPTFSNDLNNLILPENTAVGTIIGTLNGSDPEGSPLRYGIEGTDLLSVDADSGEVKLIKPFDREVNDTLKFTVTAEDEVNETENKGGNNVAKVESSIIIEDVNDNAPEFTKTPYEFSIYENTPVETTIFKNITVKDADLVGEALDVVCLASKSPNDCDKFAIVAISSDSDAYEGAIVLKEPLNYNDKQLYQLPLVATDGQHISTTTCQIRVLDVQNLPPSFQSSLTAIVQEDAPIGTLVITLQARDGDRGIPRNIVYDLISNPFEYFLLDATTGELRTAKPLDRERAADTNGVLSLTVRAREVDSGVPLNDEKSSVTAEVSVTIRDVNDEPPKFNKKEYHVRIPENLPKGSPLPYLDMVVTDTDIGNNSAYSLKLDDDVSDAFTVEPATAVGTTTVIVRLTSGSLDFENPNQKKFIVLVIAEEMTTTSRLSSTATLTVEVTDVNDNAPEFENPTFMANVNESAPSGTYITKITATDRDSGEFGTDGIVYELLGDGADKFDVDEKSGVISVAAHSIPGASSYLDYETKSTYFLTYKATDEEGKGRSSSVPLKITLTDSNDNFPFFETVNYTTVIEEGATKFEPPFFVKAEDADKTSNVTYSMVGDDETKALFGIDGTTGEIVILSETGLSRNNESDTFTFTVTANDGKFSSECVVNVQVLDVNNNAPKFVLDEYSIEIPEDADIGKSVTKVRASDKDSGTNADVTYRIERGGFEDFAVDGDTGAIRVASKLDYDKRNKYNITVVATDGGTPTLTGSVTVYVRILNTNDKNPYLTPFNQRAEVAKNVAVGTIFYRIAAVDPDTNDTNALRYELTEPISAVDRYGKEAVDGDDSFKTFFAINESNGEVSVAAPLRRDVAAVVTVSVVVRDASAKNVQEGNGTLMITILDVNDIAPVFAAPWSPESPYYVVHMQEELPVGSILGTFTATDRDSDIDRYAIEPASEYFAVNETNGVVSTRKRIDYETIQSINFTLVAYDIGEPPLSTAAQIIVNVTNVNDNGPIFEKLEYESTVKENSPKDTPVVRVTANDADLGDYGRIRYVFKGDSNDFAIDEQTGAIRVAANAASLDRERTSEILLKVEASDVAPKEERRTAIVPVTIKIEDTNDNPPIFSQHLYSANIVETIPYKPPSPIVQLHAKDPDEKGRLQYHIVNGNDEEAFKLDSNNGILYPKRSLLGSLKQFKLTVEVMDGKFSDMAVIEVNVLDVNQNKPFFVEPSSTNASVLIPENVEVNHLVVKVLAEDKDPGDNGRVTYHFKVGNNNTQFTDEFRIDENTGELRTTVPLDRENKSSFQLIIIAKDHGTQTTYETIQFLTVILKDVDDNRPKFVAKGDGSYEYTFTVNENNKKNQLIGKIVAEDPDDEENAKIFYYIIRGNENQMFTLDRRDGSIYALDTLDRERSSSYEFYAKTTNNANYNSAANEIIAKDDPTIARVVIVVKDENDNVPYFGQNVYYAGVKFDSIAGEYVADVKALDKDEGVYGELNYSIQASYLYRSGSNNASGIVTSPFSISADGRVTTSNLVSSFNQYRFELTVVAYEKENPSHNASVALNVWVYQKEQLVRAVVSQSPDKVKSKINDIVGALRNVTGNIVVVDAIKHYTDTQDPVRRYWCDLYIHMVDETQTILSTDDVIAAIDAEYSHLKNLYDDYAVQNFVPAYTENTDQPPFEFALAALVALTIVLSVGCVSVLILCCCFRHWIVMEPLDMKCDMLIKKPIIDDLSTTENPLWIEQKLKLYEEQELTMQVFCEPEAGRLPAYTSGERRDNDEMSTVDNTYATIQQPGRRNSANTMLSMGPGDYATLGGSVLPLDRTSSHSQQMIEAALGFQGCTFQVPEIPADTTELLRARSELRMNKDGQPEFVSELM